MNKLADIAEKMYVGAENNQVIRTAFTGKVDKSYLPVTVVSYANAGIGGFPVEYYGILIDMNILRNTNPILCVDNYSFRLEEIKLGQNKSILIKELETKISEVFNQTQDKLEQNMGRKEFSDLSFEYVAEGQTLTCSGFLSSRDLTVHPKVQKIIFKDSYVNLGFNVSNIEKVTKQAFANLLKKAERKNVVHITEEHQHPSINETERYSGKSVLVGMYDDQINELLETQAIVQYNKITRSGSVKSEHIRVAHRTHRKKAGRVEELLMAPTVIHLDGYSAAQLAEAGFEENGKPTLEAVINYRGVLEDSDLRLLNEKNEYRTMRDAFRKPMLGFDYKAMERIFGVKVQE